WGNWPRFFSLGGAAVIADLEEKASSLTPGDSLVALFVYGSPGDLAATAETERRRNTPPSVANLTTLREHGAALASYQANPMLRIGVFRCDGTPAAAAMAS